MLYVSEVPFRVAVLVVSITLPLLATACCVWRRFKRRSKQRMSRQDVRVVATHARIDLDG